MKRIVDLAFALTVLLAFSWLLLGLLIAIRIASPGPAIFAQRRVGRHGAAFTCYKFRTMHLGVKQAGTHELGADAVTPIGRVLRRTKLDELPQAWNILRGQMSLVGPRPCLESQLELIEWRRKLGVLDILPGITGLAQVQGVDMSQPERLARLDAEYVARQSLMLDIRILLATAMGGGLRDYVKTV